MKKIALILISIIIIATLASCDGSVNSALAASSKTITLEITNGHFTFSNTEAVGESKISFTTDAETWEELDGTALGYNFYNSYGSGTYYDNIAFRITSSIVLFSNSLFYVKDVTPSDAIVDGTTYSIAIAD